MSRPKILQRSAVLVAAALAIIGGLTACGTVGSDDYEKDGRHILTRAEQAQVIEADETVSDQIVDQIVAAGLKPRWVSAVKTNNGRDVVYDLILTPCTKKTDCANEIASADHPHVVMKLNGKPETFSRLPYRSGDVVVDGTNYTCSVVDPKLLTSQALTGLPAKLKGEKKGSPTITIGQARFICTVRR